MGSDFKVEFLRDIDVNSFNSMRGFTVLELMITVAVSAVILSIGVPSFLGVIETNRTVTHTNDLVASLNLGRSEAVRRGAPIVVCSSTDGATCSASNDWSTGWIIRTTAATPEVLRAWPARSGGAGVLSANVSQVQFQARGTLPPGAPPQLQLRLPHCGDAENQGRDVSVNSAGRINIVRVQCP
jgi:type IV fimbrial biogenesis protein FimT